MSLITRLVSLPVSVHVRDGVAWYVGCCASVLCACLPLVLTQTVSVAVDVSCDTAAAWCSHTCEDIGDSFECRCHPGYRLTDDGYTCVAADGKSHLLLIGNSTINNF